MSQVKNQILQAPIPTGIINLSKFSLDENWGPPATNSASSSQFIPERETRRRLLFSLAESVLQSSIKSSLLPLRHLKKVLNFDNNGSKIRNFYVIQPFKALTLHIFAQINAFTELSNLQDIFQLQISDQTAPMSPLSSPKWTENETKQLNKQLQQNTMLDNASQCISGCKTSS